MIVGLTGGIGSGKTTVAKYFERLGISVFYADAAARDILQNEPEVIMKVKELLGEEVYKAGVPDRKKIAKMVFSKTHLLSKLNAIIHPAVRKQFDVFSVHAKSPYVIYEAAILLESGNAHFCDKIILVTAPLALRIKRVRLRDLSSREEVQNRINTQWSDFKKRKQADFIIENIEIESLDSQVNKVHVKLLSL